MIAARCREQHGFRHRPERPRRARQHDMAHDLGARRAAGLAGHDDADAEGAEPARQRRRLGGLAGALPAFQSDETSCHCFPAA